MNCTVRSRGSRATSQGIAHRCAAARRPVVIINPALLRCRAEPRPVPAAHQNRMHERSALNTHRSLCGSRAARDTPAVVCRPGLGADVVIVRGPWKARRAHNTVGRRVGRAERRGAALLAPAVRLVLTTVVSELAMFVLAPSCGPCPDWNTESYTARPQGPSRSDPPARGS